MCVRERFVIFFTSGNGLFVLDIRRGGEIRYMASVVGEYESMAVLVFQNSSNSVHGGWMVIALCGLQQVFG